MNVIQKTIDLGDGRSITIETGKLAKQADGSVTVRMGNTVLLAAVCAAKDAVPGTDFMPLQVDYKEKYAAFGRFPGGFTRREGKPSDYEILTSRLVDRVLRPLFPDNYHAEVYVNVILLSSDGCLRHSLRRTDLGGARGTRGWAVRHQSHLRAIGEGGHRHHGGRHV